jgi:hypothetical protein
MPAQTNKAKTYPFPMDQGSKRVLGIITGIPVARHLKATEKPVRQPLQAARRGEVAAAAQRVKKIIRKIDGVSGT